MTHPIATHRRTHPMLIIAAGAVVLFCLAGTAAIMGWIPTSSGANGANRGLSDTDRALLSSQLSSSPPAAAIAAPAPQREQSMQPAQPLQLAQAEAPRQTAQAAPHRAWCDHCGNVESVRTLTHRAEGSGLGAAGGAVLGGLLGNQVGGGNGRKLATVAGAVGGAVVGNRVEGDMKATKSYEIKVRLDDGSARTFHQQNPPRWNTGDRVKIVKGALRSVS
jgi:outer membrane lipoprotein SlyB